MGIVCVWCLTRMKRVVSLKPTTQLFTSINISFVIQILSLFNDIAFFYELPLCFPLSSKIKMFSSLLSIHFSDTIWQNVIEHEDSLYLVNIFSVLMTCIFDQVVILFGIICCHCLKGNYLLYK